MMGKRRGAAKRKKGGEKGDLHFLFTNKRGGGKRDNVAHRPAKKKGKER